MATIEKAIVSKLLATTGVTDYVGQRVDMGISPQGEALPRIVIHRISTERPSSTLGPVGLAQATVQVNCFDETYFGAKNVASAVRSALNGYEGTVETIQILGCTFANQTDLQGSPTAGTDSPIFGDAQDFTVSWKE